MNHKSLPLFFPCTASIHLTDDVFDGMPEHSAKPLGEHPAPILLSLLAGLRAEGKIGHCPWCCALIWLNRTAATARPPTLVCRPSSRALRLQVPLPMTRTRAPLDLYVLIIVECVALLVSLSRSNHQLAHACTHA
jgi:hypothetical protein